MVFTQNTNQDKKSDAHTSSQTKYLIHSITWASGHTPGVASQLWEATQHSTEQVIDPKSADKRKKEKAFTEKANNESTSNSKKFLNNYSYFIDWQGNFNLFATKTTSIFSWLFDRAAITRIRVRYYLFNWVYTTNHKRIALNYFWFVIFAGICGMALATIIRLEMAYPGVGILAGDSLQYLSIVTAHAVIMVFFMIMPLLFGAFGNFLLPTQLGVHDVAFPRLNSAAFWFLPAGLIMLCQLVCLDRRYQRMNCFNIREIQAILKGRFFHDLVNSEDHRNFLDKTSIGIRFKTNNNDAIHPNMLLMFRYGATSSPQSKLQVFSNTVTEEGLNREFFAANSFMLSTVDAVQVMLNSSTITRPSLGGSLRSSLTQVTSLAIDLILNLVNSFFQLLLNVKAVIFTPSCVYSTTINVVTGLTTINFMQFFGFSTFSHLYPNWLVSSRTQGFTQEDTLKYSAKTETPSLVSDMLLFGNEETSLNFRYQKFQNPLFKGDFKAGNYFNRLLLERFPHMISTFIEITKGVRRSSWMFSSTYPEFFNLNFNNYMDNFQKVNTDLTSTYQREKGVGPFFNTNMSSTFGFFNFFNVLASESSFINHRWISVNALDQKFYRIFNTTSMQQRIYSNWRQLKFTREAWRCKLLAARHQKTMYKRYLHEDTLLWTLERNAKDVLPGWAMITPFSARTRYTAIGKVDIGLMGVFLVLNSSIVSSANFLVTYRYLSTLNNRKMRDARSFFTEGVMVTAWMMIAANPMLAIGILMLLSDRHWQTSFFDYSGGGDTVLFQHMFWFFGHPEVYVIMIPTFGFNNTILSFYLRKRVSARASLLYSIYTIAFLGFFVWGHHMYMVGLAHTTRMLFSTLTVMISVPAATKLMHWCVTLVNSSFSVELPFVFTLVFIFFFVSGGISGMAVAHTGMDILFHDSFYVVGHFHVMLAGSAMFASFAAFYFYFSSIFGVKFSRIWGYLHFVYYLLGQLMTVIPMFWLGYSGMPRRVLDYPAALGGWHAITSAGHLLSVAGMLAFFIMIFDSLRQGRPAVRNSLGVSRFNTRFNFYLYEIARTQFIASKGWSIARNNSTDSVILNRLNFTNNELLEVTLYSYTFVEEDARVQVEKNNSTLSHRDSTYDYRSGQIITPEVDRHVKNAK